MISHLIQCINILLPAWQPIILIYQKNNSSYYFVIQEKQVVNADGGRGIKKSLKARIYEILDMDHELNKSLFERDDYNVQSKDIHINLFNKFIIALIFLNIIAFILETFEPIATEYGVYFNIFEAVSVVIFTVEYGLRVWSSGLNPRYKGVSGHLRYMISFFAIIDLLSFLPFYLHLSAMSLPFLVPDGRFFRTLRLFRVIKIFRYSNSMITLKNVIISKKDDLVLTLFIGVFLLFISASFMYYFEHDAPGQESFNNLFESLYWGIVPLTAVGYGDIWPMTMEGRLTSMVITLICITMMALPTGIISEGFIEERRRMKEEKKHSESKAGSNDNDIQHKMLNPNNFACDGSSHEEGAITSQCPYCNNYITISINKKTK
jgi:voltage-gated potassium channel